MIHALIHVPIRKHTGTSEVGGSKTSVKATSVLFPADKFEAPPVIASLKGKV